MNNPFLEQFQAWIAQSAASQDEGFSQQLSQMQSWMRQMQVHATDVAPNHAQKLSELAQNSSEWADILAQLTQAQAKGENAAQWADKLRNKLHQLNINSLMTQATLPHQFLNLLITQPSSQTLASDTQSEMLSAMLLQLEQSPFESKLTPLKALLQSLIDWQDALGRMQSQLNHVSETAIEQFTLGAEPALDKEALINLWVGCYDHAYRTAFNDQPMQTAQGDLVNSLTQVQLNWQTLVDQWLDALGVPSRSQLNQLIDALDQQRRRIRGLEKELQAIKNARDH